MERKYFYITLLWALSIAFLSLVNINSIAKNIVSSQDKIIHFVFYAIFAILLRISFKKNINDVLIFIIVIIYGIIIEVLQSELTTYRKCEINDVLSNTFGALIGLLLLQLLNKNIKKIK